VCGAFFLPTCLLRCFSLPTLLCSPQTFPSPVLPRTKAGHLGPVKEKPNPTPNHFRSIVFGDNLKLFTYIFSLFSVVVPYLPPREFLYLSLRAPRKNLPVDIGVGCFTPTRLFCVGTTLMPQLFFPRFIHSTVGRVLLGPPPNPRRNLTHKFLSCLSFNVPDPFSLDLLPFRFFPPLSEKGQIEGGDFAPSAFPLDQVYFAPIKFFS